MPPPHPPFPHTTPTPPPEGWSLKMASRHSCPGPTTALALFMVYYLLGSTKRSKSALRVFKPCTTATTWPAVKTIWAAGASSSVLRSERTLLTWDYKALTPSPSAFSQWHCFKHLWVHASNIPAVPRSTVTLWFQYQSPRAVDPHSFFADRDLAVFLNADLDLGPA